MGTYFKTGALLITVTAFLQELVTFQVAEHLFYDVGFNVHEPAFSAINAKHIINIYISGSAMSRCSCFTFYWKFSSYQFIQEETPAALQEDVEEPDYSPRKP